MKEILEALEIDILARLDNQKTWVGIHDDPVLVGVLNIAKSAVRDAFHALRMKELEGK